MIELTFYYFILSFYTILNNINFVNWINWEIIQLLGYYNLRLPIWIYLH